MAQPKQDNRAAHTKIADLLQQQPAKNQAALQANMTALAELGEEGITGMAAMLSAPGKGRQHCHPLRTLRLCFLCNPARQGRPAQNRGSPLIPKRWARCRIKRAKLFAGTASADRYRPGGGFHIVPYLTDERLADPAARTLSKINSPAAQQALLVALPKLSGRNKQILVEAIGDAGIPAATSALIPLATDADKMLAQNCTLRSRRRSRTLLPAKRWKNAARRANYKYDLTNATGSYVAYAQNLLAKGKTKEASLAAQDIRNRAQAPEQVHVRTAALYILNQAGGRKSAALCCWPP